MLSKEEFEQHQEHVVNLFNRAGIIITEEEKSQIEIADFGLSQFEQTGLGVLVYVNTERCCAKELAMWPRQTCPEHRHPSVNGRPGKEETFRCRWGKVYIYVPGEKCDSPKAKPPTGREDTYTQPKLLRLFRSYRINGMAHRFFGWEPEIVKIIRSTR